MITFTAGGGTVTVTLTNGSSGQNAKLVADGMLVIPARPTTTYVYDNLGELVSTTDAMGRQTSYTYNVLGQQTVETDPRPATTR